jgi:hypothetical protein
VSRRIPQQLAKPDQNLLCSRIVDPAFLSNQSTLLALAKRAEGVSLQFALAVSRLLPPPTTSGFPARLFDQAALLQDHTFWLSVGAMLRHAPTG